MGGSRAQGSRCQQKEAQRATLSIASRHNVKRKMPSAAWDGEVDEDEPTKEGKRNAGEFIAIMDALATATLAIRD